MNKLYIKRGKELIEVDELCAGDIGCMTKLSHSSTNDTLCTLDYRMKYQPIHFLNHIMVKLFNLLVKQMKKRLLVVLQD